jgi:hypothetical protein
MNNAPAPLMSFGTSTVPVRSMRKVAPLATFTAPLPSVPLQGLRIEIIKA